MPSPPKRRLIARHIATGLAGGAIPPVKLDVFSAVPGESVLADEALAFYTVRLEQALRRLFHPYARVHPKVRGGQAANWSGRWPQNWFHVPLRRWATSEVMAKAPCSLHCMPGPLRRWATTCLHVDSIMPDPIT